MSDELFNKEDQASNIVQEDSMNQKDSTEQESVTNQASASQTNNAVTYSFWAEQIAASTVLKNNTMDQQEQYSNPDYNGQQSQLYQQEQEVNSPKFDIPSQAEDGTKRKKSGFLKKAAKMVLGAAVFGLIAGASFIGFNAVYYRINPNAAPLSINIGNGSGVIDGDKINLNLSSGSIATTTVSNDIIQQSTDITDVVESTMPSIVTITSTYTQSYDWFGQQYDEESEGGGSGIIVGESDTELLIATNNHVVEGADPILVNFIDGTQAEAIIKGTDATADLAVISIDLSTLSKETLDTIKIATLGDSESVMVGQMAIAIGNALGYGQSVTVGYISAKDREVAVSDSTMVLLQTDAAINPGNSGGALLNTKGEVIGINSVKYASSEVEGMGYAIPISRALPIINELMNRESLKDEEKGYLGVYIEDVTEEIASMYNWPVGVYVKAPVEGGSAELAGIIAGDIITGIEGTEITASTQLKEKVTSYRVGTEIKVTVMRSTNGEYVEKEIIVTLGSNPVTEEPTQTDEAPVTPETPETPETPDSPATPDSPETPATP